MTQQFRWAFIGTGTLAKKVIKEITDSGRHKVVSAYSRNRDKLIEFCEPYAAYAATSVEEAISRSDVDAVYISVTNESHYDVCRLCLEKGKNVLLEKPFTINAAQTKALFDLARKKDVYLSEAMWTWYSDVPNKVREVVLSGKLGKIKSVAMSYSNYGINYAPRVSDPKKGGGAVLDIGIYPIAYAYRLFGLPNHISCKGDVHDGVDFSENRMPGRRAEADFRHPARTPEKRHHFAWGEAVRGPGPDEVQRRDDVSVQPLRAADRGAADDPQRAEEVADWRHAAVRRRVRDEFRD